MAAPMNESAPAEPPAPPREFGAGPPSAFARTAVTRRSLGRRSDPYITAISMVAPLVTINGVEVMRGPLPGANLSRIPALIG